MIHPPRIRACVLLLAASVIFLVVLILLFFLFVIVFVVFLFVLVVVVFLFVIVVVVFLFDGFVDLLVICVNINLKGCQAFA